MAQGTLRRCGVNAPERVPVYPLRRERVRWPTRCGACVTPRAVVLAASVPLALGPVLARLLRRGSPWHRRVRGRGMGSARVNRWSRFEDRPGGVRQVAAALPTGRDHRRALEQPLKAGEAQGRCMPDQRGGQPIQGLAPVWTADLGALGRSLPRGSRAKLAGGNPGSGPPCAHRGDARPVVDGGADVGGDLRRSPGHTGQMSGRRVRPHGLERVGEVRARRLVDVDALALARAQAHRPRWRRAGRDKRPLRGLRTLLGVLGSARPPMVLDELDAIGSGQGPQVRRSWAPMQNMLAQLTRGRSWAQRLFSRVRKHESRQDSFDAGASLMPARTPLPLAPLEQPGACVALPRQGRRKSRGGLEATCPECCHRGTRDGSMLGLGSCLVPALIRYGSRSDTPQCHERIFRRRHVCTEMITSGFIIDIRWCHPHEDQLGVVLRSDGLEVGEDDLNAWTGCTQRHEC